MLQNAKTISHLKMSEAEQSKRMWFSFPNDANLMRAIFFGLLIGTGTVLFLDFQAHNTPTTQDAHLERPILPAVDRPEIDPNAPEYSPDERVTVQPEILSAPITATLAQNGIMLLSGYIEPGAAPRIIEELERTKEYIKTVQINSPGGSVNDALAISQFIRSSAFETLVDSGGFCASSCPLVFAGGKTRIASKKASIGLHQIYGATPDITPPQAMSDAQTTTAQITAHLEEMGVDTKIWIHALKTPPNKLYYLTQDELTDYKLATNLR